MSLSSNNEHAVNQLKSLEKEQPHGISNGEFATLEQSSINLLQHVPLPRFPDRTTLNHPIRSCFILALPWAAYAVLNTIIDDIRIPYLKALGIGEFIPRFLPPLTAFCLSPILGAASDRSLSKWGRRNVFVASAAVILTFSGCAFGSAQMLFPTASTFINLLFFLLVIGLLLLNIGLRARLMDEVTIEYQVHAQAAAAFWSGVGSVIGNLLYRNAGGVVVSHHATSGHDILVSFSAAMGAVVFTIGVCMWLKPEHPQDHPSFHPSIDRLVREGWDQIVYAPRLFRLLCMVYFVQYFAWTSFRNEVYVWWSKNVYQGCKDTKCDAASQSKYEKGSDIANLSLMCQNVFLLLVCLLIIATIPQTFRYLKHTAFGGLLIGAVSLITAVVIGKHWLLGTFISFIATAFYNIVVLIFPYTVVGIMGKGMQESAHGFNNNGLYIGVLTSFSAVSQLFVQIYGTENMAHIGTGNVMALPCVLFAVGAIVTLKYSHQV